MYPRATYPSYCPGGARIYTRGAVQRLLSRSGSDLYQLLNIEDVYFSGIVAEATKIKRIYVPWFFDPSSYEPIVGRPELVNTHTSRFLVAHTKNTSVQLGMWREGVQKLLEEHQCYQSSFRAPQV